MSHHIVVALKKSNPPLHKNDIDELENQNASLQRHIAPAWHNQYNRIEDYTHKLSRDIIDYYLYHGVRTIIIG